MLDENWVTSTIAGVQGRMGMNNIIDGTTVTVNGDDEKKNGKTKEAEVKHAVYSYNSSVNLAVGGGFNIETGATFDPLTGEFFLFWKWGISMGLSGSAGLEFSTQYVNKINEAKGTGSTIDPSKNPVELDFPLFLTSGLLGLGGNLLWESPNNYELIGGGLNLSAGSGVSLNSTYATYATPTFKVFSVINTINKISSNFKWHRK